MITEERDGGLFLQAAAAVPVRDIPPDMIRSLDRTRRSRDDCVFLHTQGEAEEVKLFLDTSVLLAASGSAKGASRFVFQHAKTHGWHLLSPSGRRNSNTGRNACATCQRQPRSPREPESFEILVDPIRFSPTAGSKPIEVKTKTAPRSLRRASGLITTLSRMAATDTKSAPASATFATSAALGYVSIDGIMSFIA